MEQYLPAEDALPRALLESLSKAQLVDLATLLVQEGHVSGRVMRQRSARLLFAKPVDERCDELLVKLSPASESPALARTLPWALGRLEAMIDRAVDVGSHRMSEEALYLLFTCGEVLPALAADHDNRQGPLVDAVATKLDGVIVRNLREFIGLIGSQAAGDFLLEVVDRLETWIEQLAMCSVVGTFTRSKTYVERLIAREAGLAASRSMSKSSSSDWAHTPPPPAPAFDAGDDAHDAADRISTPDPASDASDAAAVGPHSTSELRGDGAAKPPDDGDDTSERDSAAPDDDSIPERSGRSDAPTHLRPIVVRRVSEPSNVAGVRSVDAWASRPAAEPPRQHRSSATARDSEEDVQRLQHLPDLQQVQQMLSELAAATDARSDARPAAFAPPLRSASLPDGLRAVFDDLDAGLDEVQQRPSSASGVLSRPPPAPPPSPWKSGSAPARVRSNSPPLRPRSLQLSRTAAHALTHPKRWSLSDDSRQRLNASRSSTPTDEVASASGEYGVFASPSLPEPAFLVSSPASPSRSIDGLALAGSCEMPAFGLEAQRQGWSAESMT